MLENVYILKVIMLTRENQLTIYTCVFSVAQNFPYPNTTMKRTTRKQFSTLLTIKFTNEIECSTYLTSRRENWIETTIEKKKTRKNRSAELDLIIHRDYDPVIFKQNVDAVEDTRSETRS